MVKKAEKNQLFNFFNIPWEVPKSLKFKNFLYKEVFLPFSQFLPQYPLQQTHWYPYTRSSQSPPWHGYLEHSKKFFLNLSILNTSSCTSLSFCITINMFFNHIYFIGNGLIVDSLKIFFKKDLKRYCVC